MKKHFLTAGLVFISVIAFAGKVDDAGKAWLNAQTDPPAMNVTGTWEAGDWGTLHLTQAEGNRDVSGQARKYELTGAVSGKRLFLLFHSGSKVNYCATLSSEGDNILSGSYSYSVTKLRFGRGLCQDKSYPMHMTKR